MNSPESQSKSARSGNGFWNAETSENRTLMEQYNRLTEFNKQTIQELTQSLLRRQ